MRGSVIVTYNIRRSLFQQGINTFYQLHQLPFKHHQVAIVPVVTNLGDDIQFRAKELARLLPNILKEHGTQTCDLVSFSLSGIDARLSLSHFGLNKYVRSLFTVGSPHQGSKLAWLSERQIISDKRSEPIARLLGVGLRPFWEVTPYNMNYFNKHVPNAENTQYFSVGAERLPNNMSPHLRETGNYLRNKSDHNFVYENDGVFGHDEVKWGTHLVNFEADHAQLTGLGSFAQLQSMVELIEDAFQSVDNAQA